MSKRAIPESWAEGHLSDVVVNKNADIVDGPFGSNLKSSEYKKEGVPVLRLQNVQRNDFLDKNRIYISQNKSDELARHSYIPGDILITKLGAPLGKACIVPKEFPNGNIVADLVRLRVDESRFDKLFIAYQINSIKVIRQFEDNTKGTTRPRVNLGHIRALKVSIPPLAEQKRIVAKIESTQKKIKAIESATSATEILIEKYRDSILNKAFRGELVAQDNRNESASNLIEPIRAERDKQKDNLKKKKEGLAPITSGDIPYEIPNSWKWVRMGEISDVVRGGSPRPAGDKKFYDGEIPFLHVSDLTREPTINVTKFAYTIKPAGLTKTRKVESNTLMITNSGATLGVPRIIRFPTTFNDGVAAFLNLPSTISKEFLCYYLTTLTKDLLKSAYGSRSQGQPNLNTTLIANILVPIPPTNEQKSIVSRIQKIHSEIDSAKELLVALNDRSEKVSITIFDRAFSGGLVKQDPSEGTGYQLLEKIRSLEKLEKKEELPKRKRNEKKNRRKSK